MATIAPITEKVREVEAKSDEVTAYRIETFEEMGFTYPEACELALARDHEGVLVHSSKVLSLLEKNCSYKTIIRILS